ncbi:flagellar protein FliT [Sinanaerobacter chloroacetimidivorans]|jgi:hypothetical protein|uniref:Flagellar protein FliT n=1 Tax=Sinanaerobacter chloroacetimidivorans TaxID=2818044 RepID=A0A8J7W0V6_9FIRM|nr:flagellar protein FliT [Sinanaerobacter chloroacetimidivorans]MBR0597508.1 flagellar protein FliT [Sinanaerobacter chloroacetimidivorans]
MSNLTVNEFYSRKMALLKQCLTLSEELMSSLDNWESLDDILYRRNKIIEEIQLMESASDGELLLGLSDEQNKEIDRLIKLILDLDRDTGKLIRKEQDTILESIKSNVQQQKMMQYGSQSMSQYGSPSMPQNGSRMNYKK